MPSLTDHNMHSDYFPQTAVEESCPCNNFKAPPRFVSDPTEIINKILKSNDLFKDPTSAMCCESSEHMQEGTVVFEMNRSNLPTFSVSKASNNIPAVPNLLRAPIIPSFMPFSPAGHNTKTFEVLMFPTKKNDLSFDFGNWLKPKKTTDTTILKSDLQVIRDGSLKKPSVSVKKDLTTLEKKNGEAMGVSQEGLHTDAPPVTNVMNTL